MGRYPTLTVFVISGVIQTLVVDFFFYAIGSAERIAGVLLGFGVSFIIGYRSGKRR